MKYIEHLKILTSHFNKNVEMETTIADLAQLLHCSERHVKTIVNYLHGNGQICWEVQRGRGKKPKITTLHSTEEVELKEAKLNINNGEYKKAFHIVQQFNNLLQDDFQQWFGEHLGLSQEKAEDYAIDVLRYSFYETRLIMDPLFTISRHDAHMVQQIFDRLVEYNSESNILLPRIAHHWSSEDGKRWIFYLRKGVQFHHGRELTSEDVKATFTRIPAQDLFNRNINRIETPSRTVIIFHLKEVDYLFPRYLSSVKASIVPMEILDRDAEYFKLYPIGCGPFRLVRHDEDMVRLDVFSNYYGERPWLDRVEIIKTPSSFLTDKTLPLQLKAPDESWKEVRKKEEGAEYITFNCRNNGPMKDERLRQFICNIIDASKFCHQAGNEEVALSFLTERSALLKQSEQLQQEVIVPDEFVLKIAAQQIRNDANHKREAFILQSQLKKHGITSTVETIDINYVEDNLFQQYDLFVGGMALGEDLMLSVLAGVQSKKLAIYPYLTDEMKTFTDQRISEIKQSKDESTRWAIYFQLEDYLKSNRIILFINHRSHTMYEPENSPYVNIQLNRNGRTDYRKVWKRFSDN